MKRHFPRNGWRGAERKGTRGGGRRRREGGVPRKARGVWRRARANLAFSNFNRDLFFRIDRAGCCVAPLAGYSLPSAGRRRRALLLTTDYEILRVPSNSHATSFCAHSASLPSLQLALRTPVTASPHAQSQSHRKCNRNRSAAGKSFCSFLRPLLALQRMKIDVSEVQCRLPCSATEES